MLEQAHKDKDARAGHFSRKEFIRTSGILAGYLLTQPVLSALGAPGKAGFSREWPLKIEGDELIIPVGNYPSEHHTFRVSKAGRLKIKPATIHQAVDETLFLSADKPSGYWVGTPLKASRYDQLGVYCSLIEDSIVMYDAPGKKGRLLQKGDDYLVAAPFSLVGLGTNTNLTPSTPVYASYSYYLQRIDSVVLNKEGEASLIEGNPSLVCPEIPALPTGTVRFCNIYRPILADSLKAEHLFPLLASDSHVKTQSTNGHLSKTIEKLKNGKPVTIVAWGDSITAGSDVQKGEAWPALFIATLKKAYPAAKINYVNRSIGGTRTMQWLHDGDYPGLPKLPSDVCSFKLVTKEKPDLVVMEFTNDTVEDPKIYPEHYNMIKAELDKLGAELIIITPGRFAIKSYDENLAEMKQPEQRPYVKFVTDFAARNNYAIADAATRWAHFSKEGLPYIAILINAYNHPNAYGHGIFVEELMKCFGKKYVYEKAYVPVPKPISTGKYMIGAFMCPLWNKDEMQPDMWNPVRKYPEREPILGHYYEGNPEVTDWEIKYALEHGISFFNVCWYRKKGNAGKPVEELFGHWTRSLLKSRYADMFKYCILYVDEGSVMDGIASEDDFLNNLVPYWINNNFKRANYLKIDGKPVFTIYRPEKFIQDLGGVEKARIAIDKMRQACVDAGFPGLVIMGEYHHALDKAQPMYKALGLDAAVSYHWPSFTEKMPATAPADTSIIRMQADCWPELQKVTGLPAIPTVSVGWDSAPWGGMFYKGNWRLTPAYYKELLQKAKKYIDSQPASLLSNWLMLDNWNEYAEGHHIFPTKKDGFAYLDMVRAVFSKTYPFPKNIVPDQIGLGPYENSK
ncbi:glycoside hydrolase family 99-like domain-containing protein [Chitinophaga defluvii]|uniref:Glycoside hydrolase family 99-like domain-containing protein n=1 Tax=Chitinophaga defluvii TaxID=3163343 RepID=A0ABV2T104_9BACT